MVKIAVLDDWQDIARKSADWAPLAARAELVFFADAFATEDDAAAALADFDILLTTRERTAFPASLIRRLPKLRMIGITGAAVATLDLAACARQGIVVSNTAGGGNDAPFATAELALGLLIAAARSIPAADASIRAGGFQRGLPVGISLAGKSLGVVGLGRLGTRMARYGLALEMKVIAWSPNLTEDKASQAGARLAGKSELMAASDAISIHMVLSPRSRGIIGVRRHWPDEKGRDPDQHVARPFGRRGGARGRRRSGQHHRGARRVRQRALARRPSPARFEGRRADAASGLRRRGDVGQFLSAQHRECDGVSRRKADPGGRRGVGFLRAAPLGIAARSRPRSGPPEEWRQDMSPSRRPAARGALPPWGPLGDR
jgi:hypothetical protein